MPKNHSDDQPKPVPPDSVTLTRPQLARLLQVSQRTLERWDCQRLIPGRIRLPGGSVRYNRRAVEVWIAEGQPLARRS
jgi:predicted DNA-binding transcriptional regulator AlpA